MRLRLSKLFYLCDLRAPDWRLHPLEQWLTQDGTKSPINGTIYRIEDLEAGMPQSGESEFNGRSIGVAIASCGGIFFGPGPMLVAGLGLLMTAVSKEYGWSRTMFSAVPLIAAWTSAFSSPFFGRAIDHFGLRRVMLPATFFFGVSFLGVGLLSHETWHFFAAYFIIGLAAGAQGPVGYNKALSQWFSRKRGLVMALVAAIGSGLGYAIMPPVYNAIIEHYGWRMAYFVVTAGIVGVSFTLSFFLLHERKSPVAKHEEGAALHATGVSRNEALASPAFWQLALGLFLASNAFYGTLVHLFPMLLDRGIDRALATGALSTVALGAISGQVCAGILLDRFNTPKVALLFFIVGLSGVILLHHGSSRSLILPGAIFLGFGQGAELSVIAYLITRIFGLRSFGTLYGLIYAGANAAAGLGPLMMGIGFDRTGSYTLALYVLEAFLLVTIGLIAFLPPYRFTHKSHLQEASVEQGEVAPA
jgi:MFS family permease